MGKKVNASVVKRKYKPLLLHHKPNKVNPRQNMFYNSERHGENGYRNLITKSDKINYKVCADPKLYIPKYFLF